MSQRDRSETPRMTASRFWRRYRILPQPHPRGYTLIEIVIVSAILGILAIPVSRFVLKIVQAVTSSTGRTLARGQVLPAFHVIEADLRNAVLIDSAPANGQFIEFRMDANRMPGHTCNPPDDDMDDGTILAPMDRWKVGMNIEDDDDDPLPTPDGKIDARSRVYQVGNEVYIAHSWNEEPWIENLLLRGVPPGGLKFRFFGSPSEPFGAALDANADGIINFSELDSNSDGTLGPNERLAITGIDVWLGQDITLRSGPILSDDDFKKTKFWIKTRVSPILLPIRARARG